MNMSIKNISHSTGCYLSLFGNLFRVGFAFCFESFVSYIIITINLQVERETAITSI